MQYNVIMFEIYVLLCVATFRLEVEDFGDVSWLKQPDKFVHYSLLVFVTAFSPISYWVCLFISCIDGRYGRYFPHEVYFRHDQVHMLENLPTSVDLCWTIRGRQHAYRIHTNAVHFVRQNDALLFKMSL